MNHSTPMCPTCEVVKPISEFGKDKSSKTGRNRECKPCNSERSRRYYEKAGRKKRGHSKAGTTPKPVANCLQCEAEFQPRRDSHKYCSTTCSGIARRIDKDRVQRPGRVRSQPRRESVQLSIKPCATCGGMFAPHNVAHVNCSPGCTAKARRIRENYRGHKRRVWSQLTRTDLIDPVEIYERDNWKCNICGDQIDKTLKYPDMDSVSLDHVRPLSWGGTHTSENLAASHLRCNLSKRDTGPIDAEAKEFRAQAITSIKSMFDLHGDWTTSATHEDIMVDTGGRTYNLRTGRIFQKETVIDGKQIRRAIVVAETFTGPRPRPSCYVVHKNGDETDFTPSNLEWKRPKRQAKQTHCRRGHEKAGANLLGNGGCRSCDKATSNKGKRSEDMDEAQVKALSDSYYREIKGHEGKEWAPIEGAEGFSICEDGLVKKDKTGRLVKGYLEDGKVHIFKVGTKRIRFDRAVLDAFGPPKPSPDSYPFHLDSNPLNSRLSNLNWMKVGDDPRVASVATQR